MLNLSFVAINHVFVKNEQCVYYNKKRLIQRVVVFFTFFESRGSVIKNLGNLYLCETEE